LCRHPSTRQIAVLMLMGGDPSSARRATIPDRADENLTN
jgi:hypothetical protein